MTLTSALHDDPVTLSHALLDLDRLTAAQWHTRYATALRSTLLAIAPRPALVDQDDYDALQADLTESEQRVSILDDATTDAATALQRIVTKLDNTCFGEALTDWDRKVFEELTTEIQDIAEELRVV